MARKKDVNILRHEIRLLMETGLFKASQIAAKAKVNKDTFYNFLAMPEYYQMKDEQVEAVAEVLRSEGMVKI